MLNWFENFTGGADCSSSSSSSIQGRSSKRPCTSINNIKTATEDNELIEDGFTNVRSNISIRTPSPLPITPNKHVEPQISTTNVNINKNNAIAIQAVEPETAALNNAVIINNNNDIVILAVEPAITPVNKVMENNNQLVLVSSALAIPPVEPIGEHVVEWVSLSRGQAKIVAGRTFVCQTSPSLETLN